MGLETPTYIADLVPANPLATDPKSQGDDHIRNLKTALQDTFAGFTGPILVVGTEAQGSTVNDYVVTISPAPAAYVNRMIIVAKATHTNTNTTPGLKVNSLAAVTIVGIDGGVLAAGDIKSGAWFAALYDTSSVTMVLLTGNDRGARDGETWSGTHDFSGATLTLPSSLNLPGSPTTTTQTAGDNSTKVATTQFVVEAVIGAVATLPGQTGHDGEALVTNGSAANWGVGPAALALQALGIV